ncbi:MAG: PHP domain-containing protein [Bacillota bacterium]
MNRKANLYWADLHIHSALSPCSDDSMTPMAIVRQAQKEGLSIIALTDHNSALNCPAIIGYNTKDFLIIPGMELQTREEAHLVCLFGSLTAALGWHDLITRHRIIKVNQRNYFGKQLIFDGSDRICGEEPDLLLVSTDLSFEEVCQTIPRYNGFLFPAHIDRPSFSVLSNLGFLPDSYRQRIVEISPHYTERQLKETYPEFNGFQIIQSSDAHCLSEIGRGRTGFYLPELSWEALAKEMFQFY